MFTGIVEELGTVLGRQGCRLRSGARTVLEDVKLGDSTAVNGCCLTVVDFGPAPERGGDGWCCPRASSTICLRRAGGYSGSRGT